MCKGENCIKNNCFGWCKTVEDTCWLCNNKFPAENLEQYDDRYLCPECLKEYKKVEIDEGISYRESVEKTMDKIRELYSYFL